jgi:PAS domain S-box-containing protein
MTSSGEFAIPEWSTRALVAVFDGLPMAGSVWGEQAQGVLLNEQGCALMGMTKEQFAGQPISIIAGVHEVYASAERLASVFAAQSQRDDITMPAPDGYLRHLLAFTTPIELTDRVAGFSMLAVDVTPRVRATSEARLRREEVTLLTERRRVAAELSRNVLGQLATAQRQLLPAGEPTTDLGDAHAVLALLEVVMAQLRTITSGRLDDSLAATRPPLSGSGSAAAALPVAAGPGATGGTADSSVAQAEPEPYPDGVPPVREGTARPLTHDVMTAVLDRLPIVLTLWDSAGRNTFANQLAVLDAGATSEQELIGRSFEQIYGRDLWLDSEPFISAALAGIPQRRELTSIGTDGKSRHVQTDYVGSTWLARIAPAVEDPQILVALYDTVLRNEPPSSATEVGLVLTAIDITDKAKAEQARAAAETDQAALVELAQVTDGLHNVVIQHLYAATIDLEVATRAGSRPDGMAGRIRSAADQIATAVAYLHTCREHLERGDQLAARRATVEHILARAAADLGFEPTVSVSDGVERLPDALYSDAVTVLTEALANVSRHAYATAVDVQVRVGPAGVTVRVEDDGRGIGYPGWSRGLADISARAERYGGTCTFSPNNTKGTTVEWRVPGDYGADRGGR